MKALGKLMLFAAAVAAVACKKDNPTGPRGSVFPSRESLNGEFTCVQMFAFYPGPSGTGWYTGNCNAYRSAFPSRRDSIETVSFTILSSNQVTRPEFAEGALQYDTTSGEALVTYSFKQPDSFVAEFNGGVVQLRQSFQPFDLSGDGTPDSLVLVFRHR